MTTKLTVVNCADISEPGWAFLQPLLADLDLDWRFYSSRPQTWLERRVTRPRLARFRACAAAAWRAKRSDNAVIVSHLPLATLWVATFGRLLWVRVRHVAFAFNFTELPTGIRLRLMRWAFRSVDRFVVFSTAERDRYAAHFGIDLVRIDFLPWVMSKPRTSAEPRVLGKYLCAVGSEGRDYATLLAAIRNCARLKTVIVTRASNLPPGPLPDHVTVYTDLDGQDFWNVVEHSHAVVLPLRDETTCCGHITLVGAQQFGRPIVASRSLGIDDYVKEGTNALLVPPADPEALRQALARIWDDGPYYRALEGGIEAAASAGQDESSWARYFRRYFVGPVSWQ